MGWLRGGMVVGEKVSSGVLVLEQPHFVVHHVRSWFCTSQPTSHDPIDVSTSSSRYAKVLRFVHNGPTSFPDDSLTIYTYALEIILIRIVSRTLEHTYLCRYRTWRCVLDRVDSSATSTRRLGYPLTWPIGPSLILSTLVIRCGGSVSLTSFLPLAWCGVNAFVCVDETNSKINPRNLKSLPIAFPLIGRNVVRPSCEHAMHLERVNR